METFRGYKASYGLKDRCGVCGKFIAGQECAEHGLLKDCHCGRYKPVESVLNSGYRLKCDCTGATTERTTVPK